MNTDPAPFNPLLPPSFTMDSPPAAAGPQGHADPGLNAQQQNKQASKPKRTRRQRSNNTGRKDNCWSRWNRVKDRFTAKLAIIDRERLKHVLLACGIAAGVVVAILLALKLMPVALTILALLGVALAIQVWDRLRRFPLPPPF